MGERLEVPTRNLVDLSRGINPRDIVLLKRLANFINLSLSEIYAESKERAGYTTMHQFKTNDTGIEFKDDEGEV